MAKIVYTFIDNNPGRTQAIKQIFTVVACATVIISALAGYNNGIYELLYGIGACTVTKPVLAAVNTTAPPYVIAIDPGHGGMDTGAQGIVEEYQIIDRTAAHLYELLEKDPIFIPVLTRTTTDPESGPRAQAANTAGAAMLISLHANSDSHRSTKGFECFPQPPGRTYHTDSLQLAQLIVEQMRAAGHNIRGGEQKTGIRYAYYYGKEKRIVDSTDNKVRSRQSFGILEKVNCPAVLVEQCFLTNQSDVDNWGSESGCKKAAELYYNAIKQYFSQNI